MIPDANPASVVGRTDTPGSAVHWDDFRRAIGRFATGVTVITTELAGQRYGVTANAVASVSLMPSMLLVCLQRDRTATEAVRSSGAFAVNVLKEDQQALATQFATRHPDKFRGVRWSRGRHGAPLLVDTLASLECVAVQSIEAATHTVFIAQVIDARSAAGKPLLSFSGGFGRFESPASRNLTDVVSGRFDGSVEETT